MMYVFLTGAALGALLEFFQALVAAGTPGANFHDMLRVRFLFCAAKHIDLERWLNGTFKILNNCQPLCSIKRLWLLTNQQKPLSFEFCFRSFLGTYKYNISSKTMFV